MTSPAQPVQQTHAARLAHDPAKLKRLRWNAGLTQAALAAAVDCSYVHISNLEHGRRGTSPTLLFSIAKALGCTVADLLADEDGCAA